MNELTSSDLDGNILYVQNLLIFSLQVKKIFQSLLDFKMTLRSKHVKKKKYS